MLFVTRHRVPPEASAEFEAAVASATAALRTRPGFVAAQAGRCLDEPELWVLTWTWESIGTGRRAMTSGETRMALMPVMVSALDEPSAFELVAPPVDGAGSPVGGEGAPGR